MAQVIYVGAHEGGVSVPTGDVDVECAHGQPIELPDEVVYGKPAVLEGDTVVLPARGGLLEQVELRNGEPFAIWREVGKAPPPSPKSRRGEVTE